MEYSNGTLSTYLTLQVSTESERGLLGIAFDPDYATNHYFYLYYTTNASSLNPPSTPKNRVSRFTDLGTSADLSSELVILDLIPSDAGNHNGGCIRFAPDGKLYIAVGDGGQVHTNAQLLTNLSGKILRINKDGSIPSDNPFANVSGDRGEIFCYGLRNPFRFNFRPPASTLYIGDVGENTWEEVNVGQIGGNYGWPTFEGATHTAGYISPMFVYKHTTSSAAIIGGCFMTSLDYPLPYFGNYIYGDYIRGIIGYLLVSNNNLLAGSGIFQAGPVPTDFYMSTSGGLYYTDIGSGTVQVITYDAGFTGFTMRQNVSSGNGDTIKLSLANVAPLRGKTITLTSSNNAVLPTPAPVKIPFNGTSASVGLVAKPVAVSTPVTISATDGIQNYSLNVNVLPAALQSLGLTAASVAGGSTIKGIVYLDGSAATGGATYTVSSSNSAVATVPPVGTVAANTWNGAFTIHTLPVTVNTTVTITVTRAGVTRTAQLLVTPGN
jgi:hypothetical protein